MAHDGEIADAWSASVAIIAERHMSIAETVVEKVLHPFGVFSTRAALAVWYRTSKQKPHFAIGGLPAKLTSEHLQDARLYANREDMLDRLPKGGLAAEVGTFKGEFARQILDRCAPSKLH